MIIPLIITLVVFVLTTHNQGLHLVLTLISLILPNFFLLSPFLGIILIYCYKGTCLTYFKLNSVKLTSYGVKTFSLLYSFFMFLLSLYLLVINDDTHGVSRITNQWPVSGTDTIYLNSLETRLAFSFDTFNLIFIVLTTFIISLCILRCFLWLPDSDL